MLELDYPIKDLVGADYNPREIDKESLKILRQSIKTLGIVKPIIVSGNLIVAGHQRTKALLAAGIDKAPVYLLPENINQTDEIRFNQLHNGTDFDSGDERAWVGRSENLGFEMVPPIKLRGNMRAKMANVRNEICKLIIKYGNWGACVATQAGKVIHAGQYVLACKAMGISARVYRIPNDMAKQAAEFLNKKYGEFSYEHLAKTTFIQTFAQKFRLRHDEQEEKPFNASPTYEKSLIPNCKKGERIFDFGCGQADYVKKLRKKGYDIHGVELFYRKGNFIDSTMVHKMIDNLCEQLETKGLFDIVICDYVLNSVDSMTAENDVLTVVNAMCRMGGKIYFSGRAREKIDMQDRTTYAGEAKSHRYIEFLDDNGFSALFRKGHWFYQKFHRKSEAVALGRRFINTTEAKLERHNPGVWCMSGIKNVVISPKMVEESITREFEMLHPDGKPIGRSADVIKAYRLALAKDN